jgi:hypothetical protein
MAGAECGCCLQRSTANRSTAQSRTGTASNVVCPKIGHVPSEVAERPDHQLIGRFLGSVPCCHASYDTAMTAVDARGLHRFATGPVVL